MFRLAVASVLLASACGTADDRPATLDYITETILGPSCATAQCHSQFRQQVGDIFDTPEAARRSIVVNFLVRYPDQVDDPTSSRLIQTLTVGATSTLGNGTVRMPFDAPIPDADVELIQRWIAGGMHRAQCQPNAQNRGCQARSIMVAGMRRTEYSVVECNDGEVGALIELCATTCNFEVGACVL